MFSRSFFFFLKNDIKKGIEFFLTLVKDNFWPDETFLKLSLLREKMYLFFWNYNFFRESIFTFLKKVISFFFMGSFVFVLLLFWKSNEKFNFYYWLVIIIVVFIFSLTKKSWLATFWASVFYILVVKVLFWNLPYSWACLLFVFFFMFLRELLSYFFNFILFKVKKFCFTKR